MASPQATSESLGQAIGLQGTPKDYSGQFANQAARQQVAEQKKQTAQKKSSEKSYKMFDLKPGAMLKGREEPVKHRLGTFYEGMSQVAANREDPKSNPGVQQSHAENLMYLDGAAKERADFYADLEAISKNPNKYRLNQEVFDAYASGKSFSEDTPFYQSGALLIPNGDPQKRIAELGAAVKPKTTVTDVVGPGGRIEQTDITEIDPADNQFWAEKFYNLSANGTDVDGSVGLQNIRKNYADRNSPLYDPKFNLLEPAEQEEIVKNKFIDETLKGFQAVQSESKKFNISKPPVTNINVSTGTSGGADNQQVGSEEFFIPAYTVNEKGETVPDENRNFTIRGENPNYVISLKKGELILPAGPGILDMQTLKPAIGGRGNIEVTGGYSATIPVYKEGLTKTGGPGRRGNVGGLPVPAEALETEENAGNVDYKLKFIGQGKDANDRVHQIMFDVEQPITDAAILKESTKDQPKVASGISGAKEFTQSKNKEQLTQNQQDALGAFEKQLGRKPNPSERNKILTKFK